MEPVTIAIICATAFGAVALLSAFIRQLLLSRDKNLNDKAQQMALTQEVKELEKIRDQMTSNKRFDSHYQVLGANKDAIQYLDQKIEEILNKKLALIQRYSQMTIKESSAIIGGGQSVERKSICDKLRSEIDNEIDFYNKELEQLQKRRASLWNSHIELQEYLLEQEKKRNEQLDLIYYRHSGLLEKIYLRHNRNSENIAKKSIDASTQTFKMMIMAPIYMLMQYFSPSSGLSVDRVKDELEAREDVAETEDEINEPDSSQEDEILDDVSLDEERDETPELVISN
ncbi:MULTISPECIES: hypothetical protein [unclassified Legionella]|uniref:hypothetical protein n=1 Tax=unclassified Legionella TaxID=2622702 RepID=UPI0010553212|nr:MULTISPECIES: hypothetical protein [unclassified Legionella]MDI9819471.1 hypothetical protein [Legionella sp. PL877]